MIYRTIVSLLKPQELKEVLGRLPKEKQKEAKKALRDDFKGYYVEKIMSKEQELNQLLSKLDYQMGMYQLQTTVSYCSECGTNTARGGSTCPECLIEKIGELTDKSLAQDYLRNYKFSLQIKSKLREMVAKKVIY